MRCVQESDELLYVHCDDKLAHYAFDAGKPPCTLNRLASLYLLLDAVNRNRFIYLAVNADARPHVIRGNAQSCFICRIYFVQNKMGLDSKTFD